MNTNIHISFDLDGTLIDSIPLMKKSWENVDQKFTLGIGWNEYKNNLGLPFNQICKNLQIHQYTNDIHDCYFEFNNDNIDLINKNPGLEKCLNWLREKNISWSIITSKPLLTTLPIIRKFMFYPEVLITSDEVHTGKPSTVPASLLKSSLGKNYEKYVYVGDSVVDHQFAINAGFDFVEFSCGENENKKVILNARKIIRNLSEITTLNFNS